MSIKAKQQFHVEYVSISLFSNWARFGIECLGWQWQYFYRIVWVFPHIMATQERFFFNINWLTKEFFAHSIAVDKHFMRFSLFNTSLRILGRKVFFEKVYLEVCLTFVPFERNFHENFKESNHSLNNWFLLLFKSFLKI